MRATVVLIVEDNADFRRALSGLLERLGYSVVAVGTVRDALPELDRSSHVLLDLRLPDGSGLEVLRHIRDHASPQRVLVMTAEIAGGEQVADAEALAPDAILSKPFIDFDRVQSWLAG